MGMRVGAYATVFEVKPGNGNYTDVRLSVSKKNKQTGEYEQDYGGYVRFCGPAHQAAANLKERDRIKIGEFEVTNRYDKEKKITYTNIAVFSFEFADGSGAASTPGQNAPSGGLDFMKIPNGLDDSELPFN